MKQGWGMCGAFQSCKQMYLHVLCAGMVYITQWYMQAPWYVHVPWSVQTIAIAIERYVLGQICITQTPIKIQF